MNLMEKLVVNKWLVERDRAVAKVAELEAALADKAFSEIRTIQAQAIREMIEFALDCCPPEYSSSSIPIEVIEQFIENLEKDNGSN